MTKWMAPDKLARKLKARDKARARSRSKPAPVRSHGRPSGRR